LLEAPVFHHEWPFWRENLGCAFEGFSLVDKSALAFFKLSNGIGRRLLFSKYALAHKVAAQDNELSLWLVPSFFDV